MAAVVPLQHIQSTFRGFTSRTWSASLGAVQETATSAASEAMNRYALGDGAAFAVLYDELAPRLHAYLRRILRPGPRVDDALQQTFLQIHLHRGRFSAGARVEPWAYTIARGTALDLLRRERRRTSEELHDEPDASASPETLAQIQELSVALKQELAHVSPKLREAFLLVHVDGLSHAEAAQVMEIEESAAKVRSHRAAQWLRQRLARFGWTEKTP